MYIKKFDDWNEIKKKIGNTHNSVNIRAGEIRWVSIGVNVGSEIDGKGASFNRPALIVHVIGSNLALVIPMSTKVGKIVGYKNFEFKNKNVSLCIHQMKIISQERVFSRLGKIDIKKLTIVKEDIKKFYSL